MENTVSFSTSLLGQHGLSFYVEAKKEQLKLRLIMDVGPDHQVLCHNMKQLKLDNEEIDAVVLSHCHFDHTTGVASLLRKLNKTGIPVIGHSDLFRPHFCTAPFLQFIGMRADDDLTALQTAGGHPFLTRDPVTIMPGLKTSGEVPRLTAFEDERLPLCTVKEGYTVEDRMLDDISLVACVQNRGLVVITSCSHAGIVNIIRQALILFPGEPLYAVIGGLHLVGAKEERIIQTVQGLTEYHPVLVSTGHCTGFKAQAALSGALGDRFVPLSCGAEFVIK